MTFLNVRMKRIGVNSDFRHFNGTDQTRGVFLRV